MREILFRDKRLDNGEWVYGFYFSMYHNDDREHLHHFIIPLNVPIPKDKPIGEIQVEVDPDTIGQYTGSTDKNGKKIFEGDILSGKYTIHNATCVFKNCAFGLQFPDGFMTLARLSGCTFEIIGNIHDIPELLEVKP